ncbi:hypothetical protein COV81_00555 [Candidatus Peregrinibacteria bacterium CG11_big_fil_rev_8_21_14_0_20_41_10]|nr:MAG: hypothetical protein COV81_00555 [Candidatus Peregrinibacteria bacterium CG11_big_fil_rev_8_21_14_0_20_41_10]PIZ74303.1 MAG: hypothetical protein COY06_04380 [Candidatus Peregrinibacteria bacterium CG_4_10_14_0_2_um_filter_41_8]PJC38172.1 MAG: hypothetical protein CO045_01645 [Candidatus Peregrinibacteria bacterium CG_4_9_14_0_2_um_filter_41_14]
MSDKKLFCFNDNVWMRLVLGLTVIVGVGTLIWGSGINKMQLLVFYVMLFALWWLLAKLNWKQVVVTSAIPVMVLAAGRFFEIWRIVVSDYLGISYWLIFAAIVAMWAVAYSSCLLAKLLFMKFPKMRPQEEVVRVSAKKMPKFVLRAVFNEFVVVVLFLGAATVLAGVNYFVLGATMTILFMRWFVSNNAERILMILAVLVGFVSVYLGVKFGLWSFLSPVEIVAFPLWVPFSTGIFVVSAYHMLSVLSSLQKN